jgi:hypothetical protein
VFRSHGEKSKAPDVDLVDLGRCRNASRRIFDASADSLPKDGPAFVVTQHANWDVPPHATLKQRLSLAWLKLRDRTGKKNPVGYRFGPSPLGVFGQYPSRCARSRGYYLPKVPILGKRTARMQTRAQDSGHNRTNLRLCPTPCFGTTTFLRLFPENAWNNRMRLNNS